MMGILSMGNFLRQLFKRLTSSKSKKNPFLRPPQLTYLEERITPSNSPIIVTTTLPSVAGSLDAAIAQANTTAGDDIIDFNFASGTSPYTITLAGALPTIVSANTSVSGGTAGTVTITGLGASLLTIDGSLGGFSIFNIASGGNLTISGVTVSGAQTSGNGGGFNNSGTLTVNDSTITGNSTTAVSTYGAGIANFGTLNISNSTISNNSAFPSGTSGGGAIFTSGTLNISNSTLSNNSANRGGGIDNFGTANVSNTTFFGNSATSGPGGAIFNFNLKTLNITNSTISNNSAPSNNGGGIFNQSTGIMNIANTIIANSISGGDYAGSGSIVTNTNNIVEDGSMTGATAADPLLGPLQDNGGPTFTMALLAGSPAIGAGDATISNAAPVNGLDQRGINRTTSDIGAYSFGIQVTNTTDNLTSPSVGSLRAAINLANATPGNDQISFNLTGASPYTITLTGALPTILNASSAGTLTITGLGANALNISGLDGGNDNRDFNIFNIDTGGNLTISGVTVSGAQTTMGEGGAFRVNDSTLSIFDSIISDNKARIGGGIYSTYGNVTVNKSTLSGNFAISVENYGGGEGGGIANDDYSKLYVDNSTLTGNSATTNGGGIHNKFNGNITVTNSTIASNRADNGNGGGIFNSFNDTLGAGIATVTNSTISGNSANTGGGAGNIGTLTISNSTISSNSTTQQGGGILNFGTLAVSNSTISGNSSYTGGGAANIGILTITNSTLSGNSALNTGGALFNGLNGNLTVSNSTLSGNSASGFGGGGSIYNFGTATLTNSTLSGNSANNGGGIYNYSGSINTATLSIANTIIANSTSGGDYAGNGTIGINTNNLVEDGTLPGTSEITGDPNLGPLQNNGGPNLTMALLNGSAAIGAGDSTISNAAPINGLDQRGFARNTSDIGAYSYNFASANDAVVSVDNSNQVVLTLSSSGTTLSDVNTLFNSVNNTLTITAATSGTLLTAPAAGIAGISIINGSTDTITLDLNTLVNFAGLVIVGNSGTDSVTIGAGGVDLSSVTTGAANQSFTANILGTSNSTSALVLTNAIKTKGTAATYLSAGTINGSGLITTPSITLLALSGIGDTMALNLAAASITADSTTGRIDLNNTSSSAVTVTSLTSAGKTDPSGALITFDQSGGGTVTFNNVSSALSDPGTGWGAITLVNAGGGITVASTGVSSAGTTSTISLTTTGSGNIAVNAAVDALLNDGNVSLNSAGSISGSGLITGSQASLVANTGINANANFSQGFSAISSAAGDIIVANVYGIAVPNAITAAGNVTLTAGQDIVLSNPITTSGTVTLTANGGFIEGTTSLITANTVDLNATLGIGSVRPINLAAFFVSADTNAGAININNTSGTAVSVTSLTTTGSDGITFDQAGAGLVNITGPVTLGTGAFAISGSTINLNNNITTTNNSQTYTGNVVVNANSGGLPLTLSAGSGAIGITGDIDSAAGHNYSLTLTSTGDVAIGGAIGGTQALGALLITGNDISLGNIGGASAGTTSNVFVQASDGADNGSITLTGTIYNTTGQQFFNSSVNAGSFDGTRPITLSGGSAGSTINLTTAGVSSNNAAEFTGLLNLNGHNLSIDTTNNNVTTGGDITFNQTVNGAGTLTLNAGSTGNIITSGDIGATTNLTGVTITNAASGSFTGSIHADNLTIADTTDAGIVNFQGDLTVNTGMTVAANGAYNVKMIGASNTIAGVTTFGNSGSLTFGDAGTDTFNFTGGIIATDPSVINLIGKVTAAGTGVITLGDSDTSINIKNGNSAVGGGSTGTITLGNAILENGVTLTVGTGIANVINMAVVTGTASGKSSNLTINTTGAVTVTGAVGTDIGTVTITNSGGTTFQSTVDAVTTTIANTTGTVAFQGNLTLGTSLVTAAQGYNVSITGTSNSIAGATTFLNTGTVTLGNGANDSTTFAGGLVISDPSSIAIQGTVATTNTTMTLGDANTGITNNGTFSNPAILNAGTGIINLDGNVTGNGSNNPLKVITSGAGLTTVSGVNTAELQFSSGLVTIANPSDQTGGYRVLGGTLQGGSMAKVGYIYAQTGTSTLAPGINGPGMMHTNFLLLSSGNTVQIDLQGTTAATGYDQIVVCKSGSVDLASANLALASTFTPASGTVFTIIDNQDPTTAIQGTFAGLAEGAVITANGSTYHDVTLTVYNPATVTSFSPTIGKTGTPVVITGSDFTKVSQVSFNGTVQPTYTVDSPTQITTTVPAGATTGTISITTIAGTATSTSSFTVDNTAPTLSISASPGIIKANETSAITFTFSEVVTGFSSSIITVTNGTLSSPVASSSTVYTATFTPTPGTKDDGTISVSNNYFDLAGNQGTAATLTPPIAINVIQTPLVTGSASTTQGGSSVVSLVDPNTGAIIGSAVPFPGFTGEIRVVSGDFNNDGKVDIIAAAGPGGGPAVAILDSETGEVLESFFAFDPAFTGGVFIAVRDFNGDGILDIIAGAGAGGGPEVRIFNGDGLTVIKSFFAYAQDFTGGVSVASIDFNNDGILDLVTGAGPGGSPHVKVFDGATNAIISQWYAYPISFTGGVFVAAGDIGNDGNIEVVTGAGSGGSPVVAVWDPYTGALLAQFMAYAEDFTGGVRVGVSDGNFDGVLDLITGAGPGGGPQVNGFNFPTLDLLFSFFSGDPTNTGGVFVS